MEGGTSSSVEKKAKEEGYVVCYVDESAFSLFPSVIRSYAPRAQTPVVSHGNLHSGLQVISLLSEHGGLYYQMKQGSFCSLDVVGFLKGILRQYRRWKVMLFWDGASIHRSDELRKYLGSVRGDRLHIERLPSYSPEVNADEQVHGYIKRVMLRNRLFRKVAELRAALTEAYEYLKLRKDILRAFFDHPDVAYHT